LPGWLRERRREIINEWAQRLSVLSPSYRQRPLDELLTTVSEAFDANYEALTSGCFARIDSFIDFITSVRLEAGFPLSDVQKAFELFRSIVNETLRASGHTELMIKAIEPLNACLAYTIHRFSDHFQEMHERSIRSYAQELERQVEARTAELLESQRGYRTLVEEINDGYFIIRDRIISFANHAFCAMHLSDPSEVVGKPFFSFVAPECRERVVSAYLDAVDGRPAPSRLEYTRVGPPPDKAATEIKARVVDLGQGPVVIGICRDISERAAMEAKVREHERMAYVGRLSASLSHELRNPLSSIKMNLQILERKLDLEGFDRKRLEITVREVSRLEVILRQLLDVARPLSIHASPTDLAALACGCVDLLEPKASEKGLVIVQRHSRGTPRAELDAGKIEQAVINLLLNAIEACPEGGRIIIWTKKTSMDGADAPDAPWVELGVRDNGPGIDPKVMPNLFQPFFTGKSSGAGLGLSNVKRIVEAHSGKVEVKSRKGRGASFALRFPCRR
jgi:PAS domain S-box-containing protein